MRDCVVFVCLVGLTALTLAQQLTTPTNFGQEPRSGSPADLAMRDMFESKIKVEWEALKNKDKKTFGELLADDYQGVEVDTQGERTKIQALNELQNGNVFTYT